MVLDLPVAGTYRLRINGSANEAVAFRILDLAQATPILAGAAPKQSVSGDYAAVPGGPGRATRRSASRRARASASSWTGPRRRRRDTRRPIA
jgi:hypothetical protein